jgi:DNA topoisomerase-3
LKGEAIVKLVGQTAKELLNPSLSASWEKGLAMIESGETTELVFQDKLYSYIIKSIEKVKKTRRIIF